MTDTTTRGRVVPFWERTRVSITTKDGAREVDGFVHPFVPGLAVALGDSMRFSVTHLATGLKFGPVSVMATPCCIFILEWALICAMVGVDHAQPKEAREAMRARGDELVPFDGFTVRDKDGERRVDLAMWMDCVFSAFNDDSPYPDLDALDAREEMLSNELCAVRWKAEDDAMHAALTTPDPEARDG